MKHILLAFFTFLLVMSAPAALEAASLKATLADLSRQQGIAVAKQAACVADKDGSPLSHNPDLRIIPASVSKLYTFDFALAKLPSDFRYTTTFYIAGQTMYINGDGDPHFVIGHLRDMIRKVSDERGVVLNRFVLSPNFYFNWQSNPKDVQLSVFNSLKADTSLPIAPRISVVIGSSPYTGAGQKYIFQSMPLPALMKQINDYSTNISADTLFNRLGGSQAFAQYMNRTYGVGPETISFTTGSGLTGNYTTCALTLRVLQHFSDALEARDLEITDVLSMPLVDPGVLQKRLLSERDARAIVAKSGFVNYHHALAGAINTRNGPAFFAVFTDFPSMKKSEQVKGMIDQFITSIVASYGKLVRSYNYAPDPALFESYKITRR